jgi:hypothetical protein
MKATFILKKLPASVIAQVEDLSPREAFDFLRKDRTWGDCIQMKIGSGHISDAVRFNDIHKNPSAKWSHKVEPRKGYKLATFFATV